MKRNSTTLFLESPNAITSMPWVNNAPVFSAFTEPTLSVLQQAWQTFLDSGEELEIIPDPELIPEPLIPNWDELYKDLMVSSAYHFALSSSLDVPNISAALGVVIDSIQYGIIRPDSNTALPALQSAVNVLLTTMSNTQQVFSSEQLTEVRLLLDKNGFHNINLA